MPTQPTQQIQLAARGIVLASGLTPRGEIDLWPAAEGEGPSLPEPTAQAILRAFAAGRGWGLLHLGAGQPGTELHPSLAFWRDVGQAFVARVCGATDPTDPARVKIPPAEPEELERLARAVPPMRGAELVTLELLAAMWADLGAALVAQAAAHAEGLQGYLEAHHSAWNVVGRVCFHLAENKRDRDYPFAFLATYVAKLSKLARPQHQPLGRALEEYAGARNREKLLALLSPLSRAAERSAFVRELVDAGDIYHPLRWRPREAHRFLSEIPIYEQAGLVVRVPDWWSGRRRPRPVVTVAVGNKAPSALSLDALLDFKVALTLDGEELSAAEMRTLLAATEGLTLIRGRWVEVDREQLREVLDQWRAAQQRARAEGVTFAEALRLLAGADLAGDTAGDALTGERAEWSEVVAGKWLTGALAALRAPDLLAEIDAGANLQAELRPYQKTGVQWLWTLRGLGLGGCLADDMGLGKTLQVLAVLAMRRRRKEAGAALLVVPASLLDNWRQEAARFAPQLRLLVLHPSRLPAPGLKRMRGAEADRYDAVVTSYGMLVRTPWMREHAWPCVVLDEAQAIKNPGARQSRAVKALRAPWRLALTGTPVENRLGDLWSIFDFLNPGLLGSAKAFNGLCKSLASGERSYAPLRRLVQPYILRRLKTDRHVIADLPEKTEVNAYCLLSKQQAALYQASVDEMKRAIARLGGIGRRGAVLAYLMRFKQICNHPSQWLGDEGYAPEASGKFDRLRELCEPIAARQDQALVFTQFRELTGPLAAYLGELFGRPGLVLHGGTPVSKRQALVRSFQENERVPFMVLSLKAGGTGLNLTAASHVIHFDRWWNPAVENQATDRAFRIGQRKNVLVHKFVCRGTVEERIDELIAGKRRLSDELLSEGQETALTEMNDEQLLAMVSLDIHSALGG